MCFNTQPPEGGCLHRARAPHRARRFNTQPPEGGCLRQDVAALRALLVSTHSRPKAAACAWRASTPATSCFNTQPPEGGCRRTLVWSPKERVSTHSRPKAAARDDATAHLPVPVSTHSRPKAAASERRVPVSVLQCFNTQPPEGGCHHCLHGQRLRQEVSTHSRPKAAAGTEPCRGVVSLGFNTQPPEGGCVCEPRIARLDFWFQHTAARRRLPKACAPTEPSAMFQHTAARRRLPSGGSPGGLAAPVSTHSRPKAAACC